MVSTLNVVFNFIYMLNSDWPFGQFYCKVSNFIAIVSVAASVFTLMAISIDRSVLLTYTQLQNIIQSYAMNVIILLTQILSSTEN